MFVNLGFIPCNFWYAVYNIKKEISQPNRLATYLRQFFAFFLI